MRSASNVPGTDAASTATAGTEIAGAEVVASEMPSVRSLAELRGLRTAPILHDCERQRLHSELGQRLAACEWFTVGIMAPSARAAVDTLRALEAALAWPTLEADPTQVDIGAAPGANVGTGQPEPHDEGGVFLKGNQASGRYLVRAEAGLGHGILISGHSSLDPGAEDTWGPLPLDFFS